MVPMLREENRLSSSRVQNKIEMSDTRDPSFMQTIQAKFTPLYFVLAALFVVVIAVLIVLVVLLFLVKGIDKKYSGLSNLTTNRDDFMRFYEELIRFRTTPHLVTDSIISRLTPQQLEMAKQAGILPLDAHLPTFNVSPISPIIDTPSKWETLGWHNSKCNVQCEKQDITIPPLLILSLDGFSREYLDRHLVPSLEKFADCGARAERMYPSYPSKTFPNHYTIATGLYPESHGIVDNSVYDPDISPKMEDMKRTNFSKFYNGEPIWSLAMRQNRRMFCLFWPGCSINITGHNPAIDIKYNKSLMYSTRVDMIVDWLLLPASKRPSLIMAYFDQPDSVGHYHTTKKQVDLELIYLESVLNYLFSSLYKHGILDCTNIIILSDHGMQTLNNRIYVNEILDTTGMAIGNGVIGRIYMANSTLSTDFVRNQLKCYDVDRFHLYDRHHTPKRFHYAKTRRTADFILSGQPGTIFFPRKDLDYNVTSDHGYDYLTETMHTIFFARGPNIKPGIQLPPFQNIELFNLFADYYPFIDLLRVNNDVPNNGTLGILDSIYNNMNTNHELSLITSKPAIECAPSILHRRQLGSCSSSVKCEEMAKTASSWFDNCSSGTPPHPPGAFYVPLASDFCFIDLCSSSLLVASGLGKPTVFYETLTEAAIKKTPKKVKKNDSEKCYQYDLRYDLTCDNFTKAMDEKRSNAFVWRNFEALHDDLSGLNRLQYLMYNEFYEGPFAYLQNLTETYSNHYKRIVSITGTIYDFNSDGLADDQDIFWKNQIAGENLELLPTHIFRILVRCEDSLWHINGMNCRNSNATRILAFILPNQKEDLNCLDPNVYLLTNTARIRDIELLINVQFFSEKLWFPEKEALLWRTNITTALWATKSK